MPIFFLKKENVLWWKLFFFSPLHLAIFRLSPLLFLLSVLLLWVSGRGRQTASFLLLLLLRLDDVGLGLGPNPPSPPLPLLPILEGKMSACLCGVVSDPVSGGGKKLASVKDYFEILTWRKESVHRALLFLSHIVRSECCTWIHAKCEKCLKSGVEGGKQIVGHLCDLFSVLRDGEKCQNVKRRRRRRRKKRKLALKNERLPAKKNFAREKWSQSRKKKVQLCKCVGGKWHVVVNKNI